jgi:hypothetical protein
MPCLRRALFFLAFLLPNSVFSQSLNPSVNPTETATPSIFSHSYHELTLYVGQSFGYPRVMSDLKDQRLFLLGVRLTGHFFDLPHFVVHCSADLKPLALYSSDYAYPLGFNYVSGPRKYTYGGGGGIGVQFIARNHWRSHPFFEVDGGTLAFTKDIPVPDSRRVNISLDFGPGIYIPLDENHAIKTGAEFFHFSNADTARHNPSFDTFLIYVALTFRNLHPSYLFHPSS